MTDNYNGNELHYIASGTSFMYINSLRRDGGVNDETIDWVRNMFVGADRGPNKFGMLFNAFTESTFGKVFKENYADVMCDIHADSGGLQMVSLGKVADDAAKRKIYKTQADYSTVAMSFDEIPVSQIFDPYAGRGAMSATRKKVFDRSQLKAKAIESGKNLREQLEYFAEVGTIAKPMLIAQGNCPETYYDWVEYVQDQIPHELMDNIAGVAVATSTLGPGDLENYESAFVASQMNFRFDCKQIHFLGVGSFDRLAPVLALAKSGVYKNKIISYDSTTHTGGLARSRFYTRRPDGTYVGTRLLQSDGYRPRDYQFMMDHIGKFNIGFDDPESLYKYFITCPSYSAVEAIGESHNRPFIPKTKIALFRYSYDNFITQIEEYMDSDGYMKGIRKAHQHPIAGLAECRTRSDFNVWHSTFKNVLKSDRVRSKQQSLEELFG
ncbi:queuine tRNA-ribosyltransferase [Xanthomonas phage X1]|nr:queuine tRNA-ribosyltransferase [Xanthomonas phage X1]